MKNVRDVEKNNPLFCNWHLRKSQKSQKKKQNILFSCSNWLFFFPLFLTLENCGDFINLWDMLRLSLSSSTQHFLWCVPNRTDYASNKNPKPSPKHRQLRRWCLSSSRAPGSFSSRGHHTAGSVADLTDLIDPSGRLHPKRKISRYQGTSWQENCSASQNVSHRDAHLNRGQKSALQRCACVYRVQGGKTSLDRRCTTFILE